MARKISPALADITQDIAGAIPIDLINSWLYSTRDAVAHDKIVRPYEVSGTVVSTDSSGLSRLSQNRSLFEVIKLVSHPKQLVFENGSAIGGSAIGTWAADNTQMFYPSEVRVEKIISQMADVFFDLERHDLKIGMAIHSGKFLNIGGGLYGNDAEYVEELAESHAEGGEMLITSSVLTALPDDFKKNAALKEGGLRSYVFSYSGLPALNIQKSKAYYPIPFSREFYNEISSFAYEDLKPLEDKYLKEKIVILVRVFHKEQKYLLDELTEWIEANALIDKVNDEHDKIFKVKSNGNLGIFTAEDSSEAVKFAKALREELTSAKYVVNIGIAKGPVLLGNLEDDTWDIAGGAVNIASKIAEDGKDRNKILVEESVSSEEGERFKFEISGVEITGRII